MTMKIRPPATSDITAFLRRLFLRTEKELIQEIKKKRNRKQVEYAEVAALERVQGILQNMVDASWIKMLQVIPMRAAWQVQDL